MKILEFTQSEDDGFPLDTKSVIYRIVIEASDDEYQAIDLAWTMKSPYEIKLGGIIRNGLVRGNIEVDGSTTPQRIKFILYQSAAAADPQTA